MTWLPFLPEFGPAIRSGRKTATSRNRRYGQPGDILSTPFGPVRLTAVRRMLLVDVGMKHFREEGLNSPAEFIRVWEQIHPSRGFVEDQNVWFHEFEFLGVRRADG